MKTIVAETHIQRVMITANLSAQGYKPIHRLTTCKSETLQLADKIICVTVR